MVTIHHRGMTPARPRSGRRGQMFMITGIGVHDRTDWPFTITGMRIKTLKRHLSADHELTPDDYRTKWGLPSSYPMVAAEYAASRSAFAKATGLGRKVEAPPPPKKKAGRPKRK